MGWIKALNLLHTLGLVLPIFASAIVGGIGNPIGAVVGGYVIAFSEIMVTYAYKKFFIYLLPQKFRAIWFGSITIY